MNAVNRGGSGHSGQPLADCAAVFDASPGSLLADRYCLIAKLGQGGMGTVWRADDRVLHIEVAVKLIDPALVDSPVAMARFQHEAHAAARLRSTHIVHINDCGVDAASGQPFIAMDLLEGESLQQRLDREGKLPFSEVQHILAQVAQGLELAHKKGVVHRDLKPENIFIAHEGGAEIVKVLDFGIAKRVGVLDRNSGLRTDAGQMLGTPYYMSPEQAKAEGNVDHRTDIWAFGVIAYECATGCRPFESDNLASLVLDICTGPVRDPADFAVVPIGFSEWFARAVARDHNARFETIAAASTELAALMDAPLGQRTHWSGSAKTLDTGSTPTRSVVTLASSAATTAAFRRPRHRTNATVLVLLALLAATLVVWWVVRSRQATPSEPVAASGDIAKQRASVAASASTPASTQGPLPTTNAPPTPSVRLELVAPDSTSPNPKSAREGRGSSTPKAADPHALRPRTPTPFNHGNTLDPGI
jgi:serine/threonine-protein kinase